MCAIINEGSLNGQYFGSDVSGATDFAIRHNHDGQNVYITPNIPTTDCGTKPSKDQIEAVRVAHVDVDPPKTGEAFDKDAALKTLLADKPSLVVDSGGGLQAYWFLNDPIEASPENVAATEDLNRAFVARFDGDKASINVDRLLRLPGTVNWPNAKKQAAGRVPALAKIVHVDPGPKPTLAQLQAHFGQAPSQTAGPAQDRPSTPSVGDQEVVRRLCTDFAMAALYSGDLTAKDGDHSAADQALVNAILPRTGYDREQTERIWMNSPLSQTPRPGNDPFKTLRRKDYRDYTINKAFDGKRPEFNDEPDDGMPTVDVGDLDGRNVAPREWLVDGWIPARNVTLVSGDGGSGKSLLALQLCVSTVLGRSWMGTRPIATGRALYLSAEDDLPELHRRMVDIAKAQGVSLADLRGLAVAPLADRDALLAVPGRTRGTLDPTPLYAALAARIAALKPSVVVIDTLADTFGGNEIERTQARQFIAMLRRLAIEYGLTVVVLSHPSQSGMSSGSGTSGSTAWSNSVRSRLYLKRDQDEADIRTLELMKSNYGATGKHIPLIWRNGAFLETGEPRTKAAHSQELEGAIDKLFVELLHDFASNGQRLSPAAQSKSRYAPKLMASHPKANGTSKAGFENAMYRLLAAHRIEEFVERENRRETRLLRVVPT